MTSESPGEKMGRLMSILPGDLASTVNLIIPPPTTPRFMFEI